MMLWSQWYTVPGRLWHSADHLCRLADCGTHTACGWPLESATRWNVHECLMKLYSQGLSTTGPWHHMMHSCMRTCVCTVQH